MGKIKKVEEQTQNLEELKEQNLDLYAKNAELEDLVANLKSLNKLNEDGLQTDEEHLKEMMGAQTLLREEMKEKELFKEQVQNLTQKLVDLELEQERREKAFHAEIKQNKDEMIQM